MRLGSGDIILPVEDGYSPGKAALDGAGFESFGCFSSLLAISANDHIRGLLLRL